MSKTLQFRAEFDEALRSGQKTATTRTRAYGKPGDVLDTRVGPVRLLSVSTTTLAYVRAHYWREEGVESPEAFEAVWRRIHPRRGFDPMQRVYVHKFEMQART